MGFYTFQLLRSETWLAYPGIDHVGNNTRDLRRVLRIDWPMVAWFAHEDVAQARTNAPKDFGPSLAGFLSGQC